MDRGEDAGEANTGGLYQPGLSQPSRQLLLRLMDVLDGLRPQPGSLHDLPQVTVNPQDVATACRLAKDDAAVDANQLMCLACVDYQEYFQLVYFLRSLGKSGEAAETMVIRTQLPYGQPGAPASVPSVSSVWRAADWYEREAHDLFGVEFQDHPNLEPLLLYEGFEGFPGRKEFPFNDYQEF
jgi:NADH-quinone oxidoreductase subunit C